MAAPDIYPLSPVEKLKDRYVGKDLQDSAVAGPQAVLDLALVRKNCKLMLDTVDKLGISFRAHVKTHKTTQVTSLQVGEAPRPVNLVVSTIAEAENLIPFLRECKVDHGRAVNVLYGVPPSASSIRRLSELQKVLGVDSISFLVDHTTQLQEISASAKALGGKQPIPIFIKVDAGYSRAGVTLQSASFEKIVKAASTTDGVRLHGFYCHHGSSYGVSSSQGAISDLTLEISTVREAAAQLRAWDLRNDRLVLSVGATPTATSAQNLLDDSVYGYLHSLIADTQRNDDLELHAGVYPFLDLQQLATHARPSVSTNSPTMNLSDIAIKILVEVLSVYPERDKPEALVGAGTLALGREPCKSYPGWGIVSPAPWDEGSQQTIYTEETKTGWIVGRVAQEHGILTWEGSQEHLKEFKVGVKLLLWPNHACIAAAGYGWFLVVDSERKDVRQTQIVDVWPRWRGW